MTDESSLGTINPIKGTVDAKESERALLAAVLAEPQYAHQVYPKLDHTHFWQEKHRYLWRAIESCIEDGHDPNRFAVTARLDEYDVDVNVEWSRYSDEFATEEMVEKHANTVVEFYRRRKLQGVCGWAYDKLEAFEIDYDTARSKIDKETRELAGTSDRGSSIGAVADEIKEDVDAIRAGEETPFYPTGISVVDRLIKGVYDSRFYLIAARPKHGKTSLAAAIASELVKQHGFAVDFWYTDGHKKDIGVTLCAREAGIPNQKIREGDMNNREYERFEKARKRVHDWDLEIFDSGAPDPHDIHLQARSRSAANDRYCVVVDYLQKVDAGFSGADSGRLNAEVASKTMANIRSELDCVVIGLAQFNRQADNVELPKYGMLKFSGQLEQDVNDLLVWHRPDFDSDNASIADERYGILNHQLSKHKAAGGRHKLEVDAKMSMAQFSHYDEEKIQREIRYGEAYEI